MLFIFINQKTQVRDRLTCVFWMSIIYEQKLYARHLTMDEIA